MANEFFDDKIAKDLFLQNEEMYYEDEDIAVREDEYGFAVFDGYQNERNANRQQIITPFSEDEFARAIIEE